MARKKADLIIECESVGIVAPDHYSVAGIMDLLMAHYHAGETILPQIPVMKARDASGKNCENFDFDREDFWVTPVMNKNFWNNAIMGAEEKENGVRYKMHIMEHGAHVDSSRRSDAHYAYSEKTENFPQFMNLYPDQYAGTILDCEFRHKLAEIDTGAVITKSTLHSAVAICNSGPDVSHGLQDKYGPIDAHVFDILFYKGRDIRHLAFSGRRQYLMDVVEGLGHPNIIPSQLVLSNKLQFFEDILNAKGEGVVFKNMDGRYESGKRSNTTWKLKKVSTVEAFISGFIPGENANSGQVGSVCISMMTLAGLAREVGAYSNITDEERVEYTDMDGSLKSKYIGNVVEIRFFEVSKNGRMSHARRTDWRPDKAPMDCVFEEQMGIS